MKTTTPPETDAIDPQKPNKGGDQFPKADPEPATTGGPLIGGPLPVEPPPQAFVFWPPPDTVYEEGGQYELEILGAVVARAETSAKSDMVVFSGAVAKEDQLTLFRFQVPNHTRACRRFFKAGGFKKGVPRRDGEVTVDGGAYFIAFNGTVIGEDNIPDEAGRVLQALVLENVEMRQLL